MKALTTFALVRDYLGGMSITDAIEIIGNRRRPVRLEKAGDRINLNTVDVSMFCKSAWCGTIRSLFLTGVIASDLQEIETAKAADFEKAYHELQENGGNVSMMIVGAPTVIQLEPGIHVGVMNVEDVELRLPDSRLAPGMEVLSAQLEPGMVAPGVIAQEAPLQPAATEIKPKKKTKASKEPKGGTASEAPGFEGWKANVDFQTQKTRVLESTDLVFLKWVETNDDSRQLQKIAAARIAELGN